MRINGVRITKSKKILLTITEQKHNLNLCLDRDFLECNFFYRNLKYLVKLLGLTRVE